MLIDRSQAGLRVRCECGAELEVPTIRGLRSLEQVAVEQRASRWGNRQAVLLIGLTLALVGFGVGGYKQMFPPRLPFTMEDVELDIREAKQALETAPATGALKLWNQLRDGLDTRELAAITKHRAATEQNWRWIWTLYAVGVAGLAIAASSRLVR